MALNASTLDQLADLLENCQLQAKDTLKITDTHPNMDWDDAYAIQDRILARKLARGARVVGYKAGLTSHAKMKQMGVTDPVFGFLVDEFVVPEGAEIKVSDLIHPKVEPEICFITRTELKGPGCHIGAVLAASFLLQVDDTSITKLGSKTSCCMKWNRAAGRCGSPLAAEPRRRRPE
mgnify:CR=1 FL=1